MMVIMMITGPNMSDVPADNKVNGGVYQHDITGPGEREVRGVLSDVTGVVPLRTVPAHLQSRDTYCAVPE